MWYLSFLWQARILCMPNTVWERNGNRKQADAPPRRWSEKEQFRQTLPRGEGKMIWSEGFPISGEAEAFRFGRSPTNDRNTHSCGGGCAEGRRVAARGAAVRAGSVTAAVTLADAEGAARNSVRDCPLARALVRSGWAMVGADAAVIDGMAYALPSDARGMDRRGPADSGCRHRGEYLVWMPHSWHGPGTVRHGETAVHARQCVLRCLGGPQSVALLVAASAPTSDSSAMRSGAGRGRGTCPEPARGGCGRSPPSPVSAREAPAGNGGTNPQRIRKSPWSGARERCPNCGAPARPLGSAPPVGCRSRPLRAVRGWGGSLRLPLSGRKGFPQGVLILTQCIEGRNARDEAEKHDIKLPESWKDAVQFL